MVLIRPLALAFALLTLGRFLGAYAQCPDVGKCCSTTGLCPSTVCTNTGLGGQLASCTSTSCPNAVCASMVGSCTTTSCLGYVYCLNNDATCLATYRGERLGLR